MNRKATSIVVTLALFTGLGLVSSASAEAAAISVSPNGSRPTSDVKTYLVPPTDGTDTQPAPSNSTGQQVCSAVIYLSGMTGIWSKVASINKWFEGTIYASAIVCTIIYH